MNISSNQAKVIASIQLNADATIPQIRTKLKLKEHTIRYAIQSAEQAGWISKRYFLNLFLLGYLQHEILFTLSSERKGIRQRLLDALKESDRISWIGRLGGDFHYGINVCTQTPHQLLDLFDMLSKQFGDIFLEKTLALRIGLTYFGNRYLWSGAYTRNPISYRISSDSRIEIDQIDHRILSTMTVKADSSVHQLARELALPQTTIDYRIKKLKKSGVIVSSYYNVYSSKIGMIAFLCLMSAKGISKDFRLKALKFAKDNPAVVLMIECVGNWDVEYIIHARNNEEAMLLSEQILDYFGSQINWLKMLPAFGYPKVAEYPFKII